MCGYWVPPSFFPFLHQFLWHPNRSKIQTFLHFQPQKKKKGTKHRKRKKKIRKDNPNQLSINEINALQTEQ